MKYSQLEEIIMEEIHKYIGEQMSAHEHLMTEKSVPEPYNRNSPPRRPMTSSQIKKRDKIGKSMKGSDSAKKYFKKKFGDDWESYLWASATNKAMSGGE